MLLTVVMITVLVVLFIEAIFALVKVNGDEEEILSQYDWVKDEYKEREDA